MNKQDRCDRCSAQAIHRFVHKSDRSLDLMFCQHHTDEFLAALHRQGFVTVESVEIEPLVAV